jgi:DNA-binding response OmpR family regulator
VRFTPGRTTHREDALAPKTGELLVERGLATPELVERATVEGRARGEPVCTRLLALGVDEADLASVLSEKHGVPGVDLSRTAVQTSLLDLVPRAVAEGDLILPLSLVGDRLHLAMSKPNDERILAEVRFVTGREVSPYIACRGALLRAIGEAYEARARNVELWRGRSSASGSPHVEAILPYAEEVVEAVEPIPDEEVVIEVEPEVASTPGRSGAPLVLAVDDEPEIRTLVQRTLVAKGYKVELAVDGQEALDKADALVPDLILLDAMLPKVHGFEACRKIKASPRTRHVPVIMMTAIYRGWRFAQDARESYGALDYIEKPFRLEDLLRRIEEALLRGGADQAAHEEDVLDPRLAHGRELLAAGKVQEAIAALQEAVRADPHSPDAQFQLGRALRAGGDAFGAMTALERSVETAPRHLAALRALAAIYEETGFRRKAAEILERALPAAPDDAARGAIRRDLMRLIA